ncbi:MAG: hypothetical protein VKJ04_05500, partial [Vampirovibrionales bacterium]|nr:hypothetical protein [Vampirovibrionales bacterium]
QYLDLGSYPVDLSQQIETTGANGTTDLLLATMDSLIQQSLESGAITPEDANALKGISQQGHKIADIQGQLESIVLKGNYTEQDKQFFADTAYKIGFSGDKNDEGPEITALRNALSNAQTNGNLNDPALNQTVSILVNQIINISNGVESAATGVVHFGAVSDEGKSYHEKVIESLTERDTALGINTQQSIIDLGASVVSHQKANEICNAGNSGVEQNCKSN